MTPTVLSVTMGFLDDDPILGFVIEKPMVPNTLLLSFLRVTLSGFSVSFAVSFVAPVLLSRTCCLSECSVSVGNKAGRSCRGLLLPNHVFIQLLEFARDDSSGAGEP
jgi:hypothetical protein